MDDETVTVYRRTISVANFERAALARRAVCNSRADT